MCPTSKSLIFIYGIQSAILLNRHTIVVCLYFIRKYLVFPILLLFTPNTWYLDCRISQTHGVSILYTL